VLSLRTLSGEAAYAGSEPPALLLYTLPQSTAPGNGQWRVEHTRFEELLSAYTTQGNGIAQTVEPYQEAPYQTAPGMGTAENTVPAAGEDGGNKENETASASNRKGDAAPDDAVDEGLENDTIFLSAPELFPAIDGSGVLLNEAADAAPSAGLDSRGTELPEDSAGGDEISGIDGVTAKGEGSFTQMLAAGAPDSGEDMAFTGGPPVNVAAPMADIGTVKTAGTADNQSAAGENLQSESGGAAPGGVSAAEIAAELSSEKRGIEAGEIDAPRITVVDARRKKLETGVSTPEDSANAAKQKTAARDGETKPLREQLSERRYGKSKNGDEVAVQRGAAGEKAADGYRAAAQLESADGKSRVADITVDMTRFESHARSEADSGAFSGNNAFSPAGLGGNGTETAGGERLTALLSQELQSSLGGELVKQAGIVLKDGGDGLIRLNLKPESLGNVKIRLTMEGNKISGEILVETKEALKAFEQQVHEMEKAFEAQGYDSARLEMSLANNGQGGGADTAQTWTASSAAVARYEAASEADTRREFFFPDRELDVLV
jgi:hypothetical protein